MLSHGKTERWIAHRAANSRYPGGIPRLVAGDHYADAFGWQWKKYQKTQLDSFTGLPISRERLERCLGMKVEQLSGKSVLECGGGAGRFTEHLLGNAELVATVDLSVAVDANLKNNEDRAPYLLAQADINRLPFPHDYFDVVVCLGVVQHTPSPEETITSLVQHLAPGGLLVIDHYTWRTALSTIGDALILATPLRAVLKRLPPAAGIRASATVTAICDPVRKVTSRWPMVDRFAARVFPSICYYQQFPQLSDSHIYQWNELDTHDALTDYYKHRRTAQQLTDFVTSLGLNDVETLEDGNGVELRATKST